MICLDTSFLVSLYAPDANSQAAAKAFHVLSRESLLITSLIELEVVNAFALMVFRKELSSEQARLIENDFQTDLGYGIFRVLPLSGEVFARARKLSRDTTPGLGTRSSDLLHIAAALELGVEGLYSFDRRQRILAEAVHLKTNSMT